MPVRRGEVLAVHKALSRLRDAGGSRFWRHEHIRTRGQGLSGVRLDVPGDFPPPSRPAEKAAARQDQTRVSPQSLFDCRAECAATWMEAHEGSGFSGCVTPYRSRSAFASLVRPSAASASAVTQVPSVVQAWSRPRAFSWAAKAVSPRARASVGSSRRSSRRDRWKRTRLVLGCSGPSAFSLIASARSKNGRAPAKSPWASSTGEAAEARRRIGMFGAERFLVDRGQAAGE